MPLRPIIDADTPTVARPYGLLGLVVSLVVILALTMVIAFVMLVVGMVLLAATHGIGALDTLKEELRTSSSGSRVQVALGIGVYVATILAVLAVARFRGGRDWSALIAWRDWQPRRHWKLFLALFLLTLGWELGASVVIEHLHPEAKTWVVPPKETGWIIAFLAMAVLIGPIAEELVFRGWVYTSLRAGFGLRVAVLVTSVLFALAHWESTHLYALAVFPVGLALAIIRERTGSIAASITFHALYNGFASVLLFVGK